VEAIDAIPFNAAIMVRKGILTSINSDSGELIRHLNTEAAKTMKYGGLTEDEALSLITINPAKQLMIDKRVGSIEAGKDADITIYDKHPLSNYAKVQKVFIDGELYFDRDKDLAARPMLEAQKKSLNEKARPKTAAPMGTRRPS
jgi:imidazolonepropionase-like amidohydrolase